MLCVLYVIVCVAGDRTTDRGRKYILLKVIAQECIWLGNIESNSICNTAAVCNTRNTRDQSNTRNTAVGNNTRNTAYALNTHNTAVGSNRRNTLGGRIARNTAYELNTLNNANGCNTAYGHNTVLTQHA